MPAPGFVVGGEVDMSLPGIGAAEWQDVQQLSLASGPTPLAAAALVFTPAFEAQQQQLEQQHREQQHQPLPPPPQQPPAAQPAPPPPVGEQQQEELQPQEREPQPQEHKQQQGQQQEQAPFELGSQRSSAAPFADRRVQRAASGPKPKGEPRKSRFRGVQWDKNSSKWRARIHTDRTRHIGERQARAGGGMCPGHGQRTGPLPARRCAALGQEGTGTLPWRVPGLLGPACSLTTARRAVRVCMAVECWFWVPPPSTTS